MRVCVGGGGGQGGHQGQAGGREVSEVVGRDGQGGQAGRAGGREVGGVACARYDHAAGSRFGMWQQLLFVRTCMPSMQYGNLGHESAHGQQLLALVEPAACCMAVRAWSEWRVCTSHRPAPRHCAGVPPRMDAHAHCTCAVTRYPYVYIHRNPWARHALCAQTGPRSWRAGCRRSATTWRSSTSPRCPTPTRKWRSW